MKAWTRNPYGDRRGLKPLLRREVLAERDAGQAVNRRRQLRHGWAG